MATDWKVSPQDILETERQYPNLWDDIMIEIWQRNLVKEQVGDQS